MQHPLQLTTRNLVATPAIDAAVFKRAARLESICKKIQSCRVLIEAPLRRHHRGARYNVRVDLTVPGREIVVERSPSEDVYVAIRDAFDVARRLLSEHMRKVRGIHSSKSIRIGGALLPSVPDLASEGWQ